MLPNYFEDIDKIIDDYLTEYCYNGIFMKEKYFYFNSTNLWSKVIEKFYFDNDEKYNDSFLAIAMKFYLYKKIQKKKKIEKKYWIYLNVIIF